MANSLGNLKATLYERFVQRLGAAVSNYQELVDVVTTDTPNLQVSDLYGIGAYHAQSGVATPTGAGYDDLLSSKSVVSTAVLEKLVKVRAVDLRDSKTLAGEITDQLADAGAWTIANTFWSGWEDLVNQNHPDSTFTVASGTAKFVDTYTGPVAQGNLMTPAAALTASSLSSARAMLRKYKDKAGKPLALDVRNENLCLVVPPSLETTARDLVSRTGEVSDGSALYSGSFGGMSILVTPHETDANNWQLSMKKASCPVFLWVRQAPKIRITEMPDTGAVAFYAECEAKLVMKPSEAGAIFSSPA